MKIEILVGMIASGKSTYARERAREGARVISHDDLTEMLHAEYRYEQGLRMYYRRCEEVLALVALDHGFDVVIDRTHLTKESRSRWIEFVRRCPPIPIAGSGRIEPVEIHAVVFPLESARTHATRRFESDPRGRSLLEWGEVAEHHWCQATAEPITDDEGFDKIHSVYTGSLRTHRKTL